MLSIKLFFKRHKRNETENPENLEKTICCRPKKIDSGILFSFLAPFLLVIHALIGAEVFNAIETANVFLTFKNESEKCLGNYNFAVTLYHVNAISTTFGYSKFFPCTPAGRGFAVIYCLLGLPVVFVVLNDAGHLAEIFLQKLWNFSHRKVEFVTMHLGKLFGRTKVSRYRSNTSQPIPALFGLVLSFAWIFLVALYFDLTEEELDYGDCLFFTFITLTSIGLGEFAPNRYYYIQFFLFFFGLVLFSTAVKIFQANVAAMIQQITTAVDEDFKNRMLAGDNNPGGDKKLGGMIKAAGPFLRRLMPKDRQKEIEAKFLALENLKVASAQVNYELVDKTVDASIQMVDRMVDASLGNQDEEASAVVEQNSAETNSAVASVDATEQTSASKFRPYMLKTKDWHSASS